jgi:EAL domain-containing protein (putative c-di-GMP-specific phosphodiesterase class I)
MDQHSAHLLALEAGLRRALERKELLLHYQPKVETLSGRIVGAEALVRWRHPEFGMVAPAHFIPTAEETGLILPLSRWVLRDACRQSVEWQTRGLPRLPVSVNLSPRQFIDDDIIDDTRAIIRETGMDPSLLEFEITESMMMHNAERTVQILTELRAMGIHIAIDDFGIGYSSLSHLKRFPIDTLKIDQSFIGDIPGDNADAAITEAIIAIGKSLKIAVVAEGVETLEQLRFLSERNCDQIQGYLFSKPLAADEFVALIQKSLVAC